jgi:hypothetical protein
MLRSLQPGLTKTGFFRTNPRVVSASLRWFESSSSKPKNEQGQKIQDTSMTQQVGQQMKDAADQMHKGNVQNTESNTRGMHPGYKTTGELDPRHHDVQKAERIKQNIDNEVNQKVDDKTRGDTQEKKTARSTDDVPNIGNRNVPAHGSDQARPKGDLKQAQNDKDKEIGKKQTVA